MQVAGITTDVKVTDLTIEGSSSSSWLRPGDTVTYTLDVREYRARHRPRRRLDRHSPHASDSGDLLCLGCQCNPASWHALRLGHHGHGPGATGQIVITGILDRALHPEAITNTATISTSSVDEYEPNNTASVTVMISPYQIYLPVALRNVAGRVGHDLGHLLSHP